MVARKILFGTEIKVVGSFVLKYGVDGCHRGDADRGGGQSFIDISVVGTVVLQVLVEYAPQREVLQGEFHCGVGLQ